MDRAAPIGIFDSGCGGLAVLRELLGLLPAEDFVYLGDMARAPYGSKSVATVARHGLEGLEFLTRRGVKLLVIACSTTSAAAGDALEELAAVPVLGTVQPSVAAALQVSRGRRIGVLGTRSTVKSRAFERAFLAADPELTVVAWPCPLLAPLVEEGPLSGAIAEGLAVHYLAPLARAHRRLDTLVLACTHFSLLAPLLSRTANELFDVTVETVDTSRVLAAAVGAHLAAHDLAAARGVGGAVDYYVTDLSRFEELGERFLGQPVGRVRQVELE
jgi:glutamate racemase